MLHMRGKCLDMSYLVVLTLIEAMLHVACGCPGLAPKAKPVKNNVSDKTRVSAFADKTFHFALTLDTIPRKVSFDTKFFEFDKRQKHGDCDGAHTFPLAHWQSRQVLWPRLWLRCCYMRQIQRCFGGRYRQHSIGRWRSNNRWARCCTWDKRNVAARMTHASNTHTAGCIVAAVTVAAAARGRFT